MTLFVPIALYGWIPVVLLFFAVLPARRAVIVAFLASWLFLPVAGYSLPGLPDYTKMTATSYGVMLGVVLFDSGRVMRFRFSWIDLPMLVWCLSPFASSISNGLGPYDGLSGVMSVTIKWGVPYLIGRLYFSDIEGLRELAIGVFVGGLIYVPFCLYEIRFSPQLHKLVYGFFPHRSFNAHRWGGYRPFVFMNEGLALGMWMTAASLVGFWLWWTKSLRTVGHMPTAMLFPILLVTTIFCKASGALLLLAAGIGVLLLTRWTRTKVFLMCLILMPIGYLVVRSTGDRSGQAIVEMSKMMSNERAGSLQFRLDHEDLLAAKAWERPVFGWGGWGRNRVYNDRDKDITITDGMWIIAFGQRGLVGLVALYGVFLLPSIVLVWRVPAMKWSLPAFASVGAFAVFLILFSIDQLLNAMPNPVFVVCAGGLGGFAAAMGRSMMRSVGLSAVQRSLRPHAG